MVLLLRKTSISSSIYIVVDGCTIQSSSHVEGFLCIRHVDIASSISGDISSQSCFFKLPECNCAIKSIKSFHLPPPGFCVFFSVNFFDPDFFQGLTLTKNIRLGFGILYQNSFLCFGDYSMMHVFFSQSSLKHVANLTFSRNLPKKTCQFYPPPKKNE